MDESRWISQFTVNHKTTPTTIHTNTKQTKYNSSSVKQENCTYCAEHLSNVTQLRKRQIMLELQVQQLKSSLSRLEQENNQLKEHKVSTYEEYQRRLESENHSYWNRQDIEAELFEAKVIIELLLVSKSSHPQIKTLTDEALKQKYSNLLLQNWTLKEKVEARDRLIQEKQYYPIYHQDKRVSTLRKAVEYWYKRSNEDCTRMKAKVSELRVRLQEEKNQLREDLKKEMDSCRKELLNFIDNIIIAPENQRNNGQPLNKKKNISSSAASNAQKKKGSAVVNKSHQIKKFR